jgi:hypothetical protein
MEFNIMTKPKGKIKTLEAVLLSDEDILWLGQPDPKVLFNWHDLYLIPFGLFWMVIVLSFWRASVSPILFPHTFVGLYLLFGRFIYKYWKKRHTRYAVTNRRILILTRLLGTKLEAFYLESLPSLNKSVGISGVGTITFGLQHHRSMWSRNSLNTSNTGMELFGGGIPGFYDIHEPDEVSHLISELRSQSHTAPFQMAV